MNFRDYMFLMLGSQKVSMTATPIIRRITTGKRDQTSSSKSSQVNHDTSESMPFIYNIVIIATWFMCIASLLSVAAIILFAIIGKKAPSILSQLLLVMVGYLGGIIASYMRLESSEKK